MNETVNKCLLAQDEFIPEMHLRQPGFLSIMLMEHLLKTKREYKNLKKQEIQDIFMKTS